MKTTKLPLQLNKLTDAERLEFWIVTGIIGFAFLLGLLEAIMLQFGRSSALLSQNGITALLPHALIYISYLFLVFHVDPEFKNATKISSDTLVVMLFISICIILHFINLYLAPFLAIKLLLIYFRRNKSNHDNSLYFEAALLTAIWILTVSLLNSYFKNIYVILFIYYVLPSAIITYLYLAISRLPKLCLKSYLGFRYSAAILFVSLFSSLIVTSILTIQFADFNTHWNDNFSFGGIYGSTIWLLSEETMAKTSLLNFITQLFFVAPIAWNRFKKRNSKQVEEITHLKTALGKTDANLHFLKSQINPHFLFNALNTLYGTALQENAERTGEGIQRLGDMMRFMLQENIQDKIALSRDIEYLKNYIQIQKLRTASTENVAIQDEIEEQANNFHITPMLLIPFVENAFKHGISLVNPSHIKIALQTRENTLYFDVHNSLQRKTTNDPEKDKSGIGLENVKQRLALLYPNRHELIIRENASEFFVHLTLTLEESQG
jgi:two-component system, LytTR family, sensor kinase